MGGILYFLFDNFIDRNTYKLLASLFSHARIIRNWYYNNVKNLNFPNFSLNSTYILHNKYNLMQYLAASDMLAKAST